MSNVNEENDWPNGVYQYADGDVIDGGPESSETLPIRQLANRSLYQRVRNVTPWDVGLAASVGYPTGACVMHAGVSWRSKVLNSVEPGTDAQKWERWGYSETELDARIATKMPGSVVGPILRQDFGSGLVLQFGRVSVTTNLPETGAGISAYYGKTDVAFTSPFPNQLLGVVCTMENTQYIEINAHVEALTTGGFRCVVYMGSNGVTANVNWIAFGT
jgi:hypothetical protein